MKKCPYCGYENDEQATVCQRCKAGFNHEETEENVGKPVRGKRRTNKESE